jgi:hypothetical protein
VREYEQGPFPAVDVRPWSAAFVALYERMTGRRFDPEVHATYERIRSYLGHEGVEDSPVLEAARWREDTTPARAGLPPVAAPSSERSGVQRAPGRASQARALNTSGSPPDAFDAHDLGDD